MDASTSANEHVRAVLKDTFANRYTCKRYDPEGHVSDEDFAAILDVAHRSPSSFGMEPWRLLVIENDALLDDILEHAWGAKKNADRTVIILARKGVNAESAYVEHIETAVKGMAPEELPGFREMFGNFQKNNRKLTDERSLYDWASKQTYIVLGNMLTAAAMLSVDSTPIEGFDIDAIDALLAERGLMDPAKFSASLMIQFGKAADSHFEPRQTRRPVEEVIEYVR